MVSTILLAGVGLILLSGGAVIAYLFYIRWAVLSGRKGQAAMWAASLVATDDEEFIEAMRGTPQRVLAVYGSEAESKEELREMVVEGYEQAEKRKRNP